MSQKSPATDHRTWPRLKGPKLWLNGLLFHLVWIGIIAFQSAHRDLESLIATLVYLIVHFVWISPSGKVEAPLVLALAALGYATDFVALTMGSLEFSHELVFNVAPPFWLFQLWLVFATTLRGSMHALVARPWVGAMVASVSAPLTYGMVGKIWGLSGYPPPTLVPMIIHGVLWGGYFWSLHRTLPWLEDRCRPWNLPK